MFRQRRRSPLGRVCAFGHSFLRDQLAKIHFRSCLSVHGSSLPRAQATNHQHEMFRKVGRRRHLLYRGMPSSEDLGPHPKLEYCLHVDAAQINNIICTSISRSSVISCCCRDQGDRHGIMPVCQILAYGANVEKHRHQWDRS